MAWKVDKSLFLKKFCGVGRIQNMFLHNIFLPIQGVRDTQVIA